MSSKPETALSRTIRDALSDAGFWVLRIQSGNVRVKRGRMHLAPKGTPDLLLVEFGAWGEVKVPGKKLRAEQVEWHERARAAGVQVFVWEDPGSALRDALKLRQDREYERQMGWTKESA